MYCIIDDREAHLVEAAKVCQSLPVQVKRLLLGDVLLCDKSDENVLCVIERKRLDDLLCSLHTGHMQEQLSRLGESATEVWIVIEHHPGHDDQRGHVISWIIQILTDAQNNKVRIISTVGVADTWLFIQKRASMLSRQDQSARLSQWAPSKRRHLPVYLKSLLAIPGVSFKRADAIRTLYPTLMDLCSAIMHAPEATEGSLRRAIGKSATKDVFNGITAA